MNKKVLFILVGILFVGIGIFVLVSGNQKANRCNVEIVGTIVEIEEEMSADDEGNNSYTYYPVVMYQANGRTITEKSNVGSSSYSKYRINDKIDILYNPDNVEEFVIKGDKTSNILGIIFIFLGSAVAVVGIFKSVY